MKSRINNCHIYLFVVLLCELNGILYAGGSLVSTIFQLILIGLSLYYVFYANNKYTMPIYFKALNILLLMFTLYGFILMLSGERFMVSGELTSNTQYLKSIYKSLLPVYAFYVFTKQGLLKESILKVWFFVFLFFAVRSFFGAQMSLGRAGSLDYEAEFTNNAGYAFVLLLPALILFYKKPIIEYLGMLLCGYFIVISLKRGAIICGALCMIWYLIVNFKSSKGKQKWIVVVVFMALFVLSFYFVGYMKSTSEFFSYRIEQTIEGNSSGRDDYFAVFYNHFINESNPLRLMFGNAANATLKIAGNYAHNDWLEIAINQGLLGVLVYLFYWLSFYKTWRQTKPHPQAFMSTGMLFIVFFLETLFSMSYNCVSRYAAMLLGYYLVIGTENFSVNKKNGDITIKTNN